MPCLCVRCRGSKWHASNRRVFAKNWPQRLVRTQLNRFYNQALLQHLLESNETLCEVPRSSEERGDSRCSRELAGTTQEVRHLHERLLSVYARGEAASLPLVPDHPHCTHVVRPRR
jgi:hypothetical protein